MCVVCAVVAGPLCVCHSLHGGASSARVHCDCGGVRGSSLRQHGSLVAASWRCDERAKPRMGEGEGSRRPSLQSTQNTGRFHWPTDRLLYCAERAIVCVVAASSFPRRAGPPSLVSPRRSAAQLSITPRDSLCTQPSPTATPNAPRRAARPPILSTLLCCADSITTPLPTAP